MGEHGDVVSSSPYCAAGLAARAPRFRAFGTAVAPRTASPRAAALVPATHGHLETEICEALGQNLSACIAQPLRMLSPPDHTIHAVSKQVSGTRTSAAGTITGAEQRWHCRRDRRAVSVCSSLSALIGLVPSPGAPCALSSVWCGMCACLLLARGQYSA